MHPVSEWAADAIVNGSWRWKQLVVESPMTNARNFQGAMEATLAGVTLVLYDFILTLPQEARYMWGRRFSGGHALFYIVRYSAVFGALMITANVCLTTPGLSLQVFTLIEMILDVVLLVGTAVFSALRAYAVSRRSIWVLVIVLVLGMLNPIVYVLTFAVFTRVDLMASSQPGIAAPSHTAYENFIIAARVCAVAADAFVLFITWKHCIRRSVAPPKLLVQNMGRWDTAGSLINVIVKDGILYFSVLLIINIVGLALSRTYEFIIPMSAWVSGLASIMTSRFILDLQAANESILMVDTGDSTTRSNTQIEFRTPSERSTAASR
ncbi:hypothetical protein C8Q78DRAFT_997302 [Trametes maxima]|nr:hypothetical protein C8Q78DRAFT_997302 [Trametes maxima]